MRAEAEFAGDSLEVRLVVDVDLPHQVSTNMILDKVQDVVAGALASLGHPPESVRAILATWHEEQAATTRESGEF